MNRYTLSATRFDGSQTTNGDRASLTWGKQTGEDLALNGILCKVCELDEVLEVDYINMPFTGSRGNIPGLIECMRVTAVKNGAKVQALIPEHIPGEAPGTKLHGRSLAYTKEAAKAAEWKRL